MNCPKCKHKMEQADFTLTHYNGSNGPEIDLKFDCPECGETGYTFVPMSDFCTD